MHAQTEIRELTAEEINQVDGGAITRGCIPPMSTLDPRFLDWVVLPNPWIAPLPIITGPLP
jgi:hypothetical protein